ncbi:MAG TPA: HEAT repeat domain-containing protein [Kofleriaceae bacterium]|nr:HEAT repeat domain-containing protein [Kofleriaceae bacterium]
MRRAAGALAAGLLLAVVPAGCDRKGSDAARARPADAGGGSARAAGGEPRARQPEVATLTGVAIQWSDGAAPAGISDEELSRRIGAILTASPAFLLEGEAAPAGRVAVPAVVQLSLHREVVARDAIPGEGPGGDKPGGAKPGGAKPGSAKPGSAKPGGAKPGGREAVVGVEAEVSWRASGMRMQPRENILVHRPVERRDQARLDQLIAALVVEAVEQAASGLVAKETLRQADDPAVLAAFGSRDPDEVLWALDLAAERRLAAAFDRAVAMLDARDPGVQAAALRVLVALRDPRAVKSLAHKADFADPDTMRSLIEAVTAIGGPEAIEFLELVASGHADADMRQRAQEGLERLGRRKPPGP